MKEKETLIKEKQINIKEKEKNEILTPTKRNKEYKKWILEKFEEFNNNGKTTLCIFCDTYYPILDGVIVTFDNYAKRLKDDMNIVVCVPKFKGKVYTHRDYVVLGINSVYFDIIKYGLAFPKLDTTFKKLLKNLRVDIIHSHSPFTVGAYADKFAKKHKIPLVCHFHSQYKQDFEKAVKSKAIVNLLMHYIMRQFKPATEVWTMNDGCVRTIREYGYTGSIYKMPNSITLKRKNDKAALVNEANEKFGLAEVENVFVFVGRLVSQKNILFIIDALKILKEKGIKFKMLYVGTGPDESKLREHITENKLDDDVVLLGRVSDDDLHRVYARAKLLLLPSLYDTSSLTQIEAAMYDTPSVLIKGSVTADTITDNENGYLTEATPTQYAEKIYEIVNDNENYERISNNTYSQLYVHFDDIARRAFERYKYLISENNKVQANEVLSINNRKIKKYIKSAN